MSYRRFAPSFLADPALGALVSVVMVPAAVAAILLLLAACSEPAGLRPVAGEGSPTQTVWNPEPHPEGTGPRIDVGFCLDSTGSMSELIAEAKARIRQIDQELRAGNPPPSVRFGVVAYRDRHDDYVTRLYGLSPDVEKIQQALGDIRADGGGDVPEHVVAGLRQAVDGLGWDPEANLRFLFLVGDAPPHLDYGEESDVGPVLETAQSRDIVIGAIVYGETMDEEGQAFWQRVAAETGGPTEGLSVAGETMLESLLLDTIRREAARRGVGY